MTDRVSAIPLRAALAAFAVAMVILAQGITAPFVKDAEPQAAAWIQDVASGNHLLVPRDWYGELARKPPLFYWAAGVITAATGGHVDEARARVLSVLAAAAIAITTLIWTGTFIDSATGWLAFLFLLGSFAFTSRGTLALEDMTLLAFVFAGWCQMYAALEQGASYRRIIAIGAVFGLGALTKGPVAIVLPAFGATIYLLMTHRSIAEQLKQPWPWVVLAIAIAIALPWYVAAMLSGGSEIARIIFQENAGHFLPVAAGGIGEAARPFYYIATKMIGGITPLNLLLPALVVALIRGDFVPQARKPLMFQLSFLIAMLVFFSAASAKRDDYVLPGIPPLAILFAALFTSIEKARIVELLRDIAAIVVALLAVAALIAASIWISIGRTALVTKINPLDRGEAELFIKYYVAAWSFMFVAAALVAVACAALVIQGVLRKRSMRTAVGLGLLSLVGVLMFTAVLRPEIARDRTLKDVAADIDRIAPNAPVYVTNVNEELSFYLGREAQLIIAHKTIRSIDGPAYLFAYQRDFRDSAAPLRERVTLVQQWERLGSAGPAALYRLDPEGLKPRAVQDK
jgi:4-amino-4-deoxy-L-arabinose transferase-like glycosyltransferase